MWHFTRRFRATKTTSAKRRNPAHRLKLESLERRQLMTVSAGEAPLVELPAVVSSAVTIDIGDIGRTLPGSGQTAPANPAPDATAVLNHVRQIVGQLEVGSLEELGTIHFAPTAAGGPVSLSAGVHLLRQGMGANLAPPSAPTGWTAANTGLLGVLDGGETGDVAAANAFNSQVLRYQNSEVTDTAVILAKDVVLDGDVLVLSDNITQFIIVAETIRSTNGAKITWFGAGATADSIPAMSQAAHGTPTFDPHTSGGDFYGEDGGDGTNGSDGRAGETGRAAPSVFLYVKDFLLEPNTTTSDDAYQASLPEIDLTGQRGGRGQQGQQGGDGGDGAKGRRAINGMIDCRSGPGYGGDGGEGGDGGDGGRGGIGGSGGHVFVRYVHDAADTNLQAAGFVTAGGAGGAGGAAGLRGQGGEGGDEGNASSRCDAEPERAGDDGDDGQAGHAGPAGIAGNAGTVHFESISLTDWETAFTSPYLVQANDARVTETVVLETINVSGPVTLTAVDDLDGSSDSFSLQQVDSDQYAWDIPETMDAGNYTVTIQRASDAKVTNTYRVEVLPWMEGIEFANEYEARPGGSASVVGLGFRDGVDVVYDGLLIHPHSRQDQVNVAASTEAPIYRDRLHFTIPVTATDGAYFSRDNGQVTHSVRLDQPFPLSDSDAVSLALKRTDGLTFQPSENGFDFENGDMFRAVSREVTQGDYSFGGALHGLFGDNGMGGDAYDLFLQTYGQSEVNGLGGLASPLVWANFGLWYSYFASPEQIGTGACFGLSTLSMRDFFAGVETQDGKAIEDVVNATTILHGRQLSDEIVRLQVAETLLDGASQAVGGPSMTEIAVRYIAGFLQQADDEDGRQYAPLMSFIPSFDAYADVLTQSANVIGETANVLDGISPQDAWNDLEDAYHDMVDATRRSHTVTPYRAVYETAGDSLPSRIYFYDSNRPGDDDVYLDIYRDGGEVKFRYDGLYGTDVDPDTQTPGDFMLAVIPVGMPAGNVDLLFDEEFLALGSEATAGPAAAAAIYDTIATMLDAARFLLEEPDFGGEDEVSQPATINVGDTNGDLHVDLEDLNNVRNYFGTIGAGALGDATGDGRVDLDDMNAVRNNFGTSFAAPETRGPEAMSFAAPTNATTLSKRVDDAAFDLLMSHYGADRTARHAKRIAVDFDLAFDDWK